MTEITQRNHDEMIVELVLTIKKELEPYLFECFQCCDIKIHDVKIVEPSSIRFVFSSKQKEMNTFMQLFKMRIDAE